MWNGTDLNTTLLKPAGITSKNSVRYRGEEKLLEAADDVDAVFVNEVFPTRMKWNLQSIGRFRFISRDINQVWNCVCIFREGFELLVGQQTKSCAFQGFATKPLSQL